MQRAVLLFLMSAMAVAQTPPIRIILVGDSTMAVKSGWGPGFCGEVVTHQVTCLNMAKGGRSSGSYRQEGSWGKVMEVLHLPAGFAATYVLIQFGHNDQPGKPGRSTDLATEFPVNIRGYVDDVRASGAQPILVTPLTRRTFREGKVRDTLGPWADATRKAGEEAHVPVLKLNADSIEAVQKMGAEEADTLAMAPKSATPPGISAERKGEAPPAFDYTHLGAKGSSYFAHMVARELITAVPALQPYLQP